jgi:hypothetical protein
MSTRTSKQFAAAAIAASVLCWAVGSEPAKAANNTNTNTNVTTVVHDLDLAGNQLLTRSDDYNGTGQATYTSVSGGSHQNLISSWIQSAGGWVLDLFNQSLRTLYITPNDPINASQPLGPPPGYYWQNVEAYSVCYDQSGNQVPFPNLTNGSGNCSLGIDFYSGGAKYKLVMSPHMPAAGPATGLAQVACNSVNNGQCVSWTIQPNMGAVNPTVSNLYRYGTHGLVFVGQYNNTFRIDVTNP